MACYLIYTTLTTWNEPPRSRHQITACLKDRGTVYFVEQSKNGLPRIQVHLAEENVVVITPYFPVDYRIRYRTPGLNEVYHYWLLDKIKDLQVDFEIVFTFDHTSHVIHQFYPNVIYYCGDDFIGNADVSISFINNFHRIIEKKLVRRARMCVVTSEYLLDRNIQFNKSTRLVPLGAPTIGLVRAYKESANKSPVLGIVAFLNRKIPLDVLDQLLSEYKIYLIGPAEQHIVKRYQHHKNAVFTGPKSGLELYQLLENEVDVCIAPYAEDKINKGVTPNKLWLYLALGKPCVVTEIPNIKSWNFNSNVIYKCSNQDFSRTCKKAFEENHQALFAKRIEIASINSWEKRVESILDQYDQLNQEVPAEVLTYN